MKNHCKLALLLCFVSAELLFTKQVSATPNLLPFTPTGWTYPVVVTRNSGSTIESSNLLTTDSLYAYWAFINNGSAANTQFYLDLYLDNTLEQRFTIPSLGMSFYETSGAFPLGSLSAGTHTVSIVIDPTHVYTAIANTYTNTITVSPVVLSAPTPNLPADGATGQFEVPAFGWSLVANTASYRILIATNAADLPTSPTATNGGPSVVIDAVTPTNSFSPTIQLNPNTTYYWEVHAVGAGSDDGTWSSYQIFTTGPAGNGINIIPNFDSSITSDPQAATIEATIKAAISVYHQNFSDPITVNITFAEMADGLGLSSGTYYNLIPYTSYRAALVSHATTADDTNALAHLPNSLGNPVTGDPNMTLNYALCRALGFGAAPGNPDSTISLNTATMNLSSLQTDPSKYSLFSTVSHEIDEALGFGSALNGLANGAPAPIGPVDPEDLFRYDASGNRSLNTSASSTAFFALDGVTDIAQFNQFSGGDFGDWYSYDATVVPQVQDAFLDPGVNPILGVELRVHDVIGYTRVTPTNNVPVLTGAVLSSGNLQFNVLGLVGTNYIVYYSTNLTNWQPLSTNVIATNGVAVITDSVTANGRRFYSARAQ
jgi:hypothetical protein